MRTVNELEAYENLANAIIVQACEDYRLDRISDNTFALFCKSKWYSCLTRVPPDYLLSRMRREKEVYQNGKAKKRYKSVVNF